MKIIPIILYIFMASSVHAEMCFDQAGKEFNIGVN